MRVTIRIMLILTCFENDKKMRQYQLIVVVQVLTVEFCFDSILVMSSGRQITMNKLYVDSHRMHLLVSN